MLARTSRTPIPQKRIKKSIDTRKGNSVSRVKVPKQTKDFYPVSFLSARNAVIKKQPKNMTGKEKEHIQCIH
jgi:predicted metal-dependent hydrolase